jgi:EAL domain-containing protein (putative c-di-GMP-specific phosphodiesterase class I)/CheY-like chemotaxis protein
MANTLIGESTKHAVIGESTKHVFGRRKVRPTVCVVDSKQHIRTFLAEALEELGFLICECARASELGAMLDAHLPDLIVLGLSAGGVEGAEILNLLADMKFNGKVLLLGSRDLPAIVAVRNLGEDLGLVMLPMLSTPFGDGNLRDSVVTLLPIDEPPTPPVDLAEAVSAGWLELWYQPKLDTHTFSISGAEALIRIRHPTWGVVPPAYFIADDGDPHFRALSEFVIGQAVDDWRHFVVERGHIEIAINLPIDFLRDPEAVRNLCLQMPNHPAFEGIIIETNGTEVLRNVRLMKDVARQVRFYNIGISIDDLGAEWPSFAEIHDFPFVEIKVDRKFVAGCADDRLKQTVCRSIINFADTVGARTVAEGVETRNDFRCTREMGFDMVQGFLFAKPMPARKFERTVLRHPVTMPR